MVVLLKSKSDTALCLIQRDSAVHLPRGSGLQTNTFVNQCRDSDKICLHKDRTVKPRRAITPVKIQFARNYRQHPSPSHTPLPLPLPPKPLHPIYPQPIANHVCHPSIHPFIHASILSFLHPPTYRPAAASFSSFIFCLALASASGQQVKGAATKQSNASPISLRSRFISLPSTMVRQFSGGGGGSQNCVLVGGRIVRGGV